MTQSDVAPEDLEWWRHSTEDLIAKLNALSEQYFDDNNEDYLDAASSFIEEWDVIEGRLRWALDHPALQPRVTHLGGEEG
jgi:hypothetical protein